MRKIAKILGLLGILVILSICFLAYVNHSNSVDVSFYSTSKHFNDMVFISALALYTAFGTFLICYYFISSLQFRLKKQSRTTEKASINSQESSDKVRLLQSKIDTLEIALKDALTKK